jgi:hypothetical protein
VSFLLYSDIRITKNIFVFFPHSAVPLTIPLK